MLRRHVVVLLLTAFAFGPTACDPPKPDRGIVIVFNGTSELLKYADLTGSWGNNPGLKIAAG
jgi:hypothetical protein